MPIEARLFAVMALACVTAVSSALGTALVEPALASTVSCGDTITTDTTLHRDLINCTGGGLVIGANDITLNLNGHTIDGNDADVGVNNPAGHSGVVIKGGAIREFDIGVLVADASDDVLRELAISNSTVGVLLEHVTNTRIANDRVSDNRFYGIVLVNASEHNQIRGSTVSGSAFSPAVGLNDSDQNRVEKNVIEGSDEGLQILNGAENDVRENAMSHNLGTAISVDQGSAGNRVDENLITDNGDGITTGEASNTRISRNVVMRSGFYGAPDAGGFGILISGSDDNTVDRNVVAAGRGPAIYVASLETAEISDRNVISSNIANSTLDDGILVDAATDTLIRSNRADRNGDDGIEVHAPATTLVRNSANRNHDLGINAVPGVTDGGGNHAFGNGNPAQCLNVAC
jgi:parallel beta-helix repeat protein